MNLQITEQHLQLIRLCHQHGLRYLIRDDNPWGEKPSEEEAATPQMQLWLQGASNQNEDKFQSKILAEGFKASNYWGSWVKIRTAGWGDFIDLEFLHAYQRRVIYNHEGQSLYFYPSDSVAQLASPNNIHKVDLDYTAGYSFKDNLRIINTMNFFQVQYLLIDVYPILEPIGGDPTDTQSMVVWVNPTEENAKNFRKASAAFSGNPPSVKEMCRKRRYRQGKTYFQTYYKDFSFETQFQTRRLINYDGVEVAFGQF